MKRLQAFKFQLRPGGQQECEMRRFAGACRFVFNRALARQNENHEAGNKYIPYGKMASWLVEWKNATETQWLKDSPSQPLQQSLKDLERASSGSGLLFPDSKSGDRMMHSATRRA